MLKPGSKFVCTELMQSDDASSEAMQPIYDRIKRKFLTPELCREMAQKAGFQVSDKACCPEREEAESLLTAHIASEAEFL